MPSVTELKENREQLVYSRFKWEIWGQVIIGEVAELPKHGDVTPKLALEVAIPLGSENVVINLINRKVRRFDGVISRDIDEECYAISFSSKNDGSAQLIVIPRDLYFYDEAESKGTHKLVDTLKAVPFSKTKHITQS